MSKRHIDETWIDGFNLFYRWSRTRNAFRAARDTPPPQEHALHLLAQALDALAGRCIVYMDGGPHASTGCIQHLRVRYPGPGRKADDLLLEALSGRGKGARQVCVVTDDRDLAASARALGAAHQRIEDWIRTTLHPHRGPQRPSRATEPKPSAPDGAEVDEWMNYFGYSDEDLYD